MAAWLYRIATNTALDHLRRTNGRAGKGLTQVNYLIPAALQNGVPEEEIGATISLVGQIRRNAASFIDRLAACRDREVRRPCQAFLPELRASDRYGCPVLFLLRSPTAGIKGLVAMKVHR